MGLFGSYDDRELRARIETLEKKLAELSKMLGVPELLADFPPAAADAARRGDIIEAIKHYRAAEGTGLKESKEAVEEWMRQQGLR